MDGLGEIEHECEEQNPEITFNEDEWKKKTLCRPHIKWEKG